MGELGNGVIESARRRRAPRDGRFSVFSPCARNSRWHPEFNPDGLSRCARGYFDADVLL